MTYDFSGYATKNDLRCADGRTIRANAFIKNDGQTVPLVWQHSHNSPDNVLGHALLQNRTDGVYAYCKFNETPAGKNAKLLVEHGDIKSLSIFANKLVQKGGDVLHGAIKEVSLVLSGANPGALIDNVAIQHSDGYYMEAEEEAIIYTGEPFVLGGELAHSDNSDRTVGDVLDSLTEEQQNAMYYVIGQILEDEDDDAEDVEHSDILDYEGVYEQMTRNVFEQNNAQSNNPHVLTHNELQAILIDAPKFGSLREAALAHAEEFDYGIENIDWLFPDAKNINQTPDFIKRETSWVAGVLNGTRHTPFARIKTMHADITEDEARAKGYIKGNLKKEEVFKLLRRTTTPTTIYKKQKLDRDDIIDITDFDVVMWLKQEMRIMLDEEIARAILIGDGREVLDEDKINEDHIRPIAHDDELYAHPVSVPPNVSGESLIEMVLRERVNYKGSGNPTFYTTDAILLDLLLLKDKLGRRLYNSETELATALRVNKIVTVEVMETLPNLLGILVNLKDYNVGTNRGGQISMFDDFDIDYNQHKYLMETRLSGALVRPKSALVFKRAQGTEVTPTVPTFNETSGVVTIPTKTGVVYFMDDDETNSGAQTAIDKGESVTVTAAPDTGYYFPHNTIKTWVFTRELGEE